MSAEKRLKELGIQLGAVTPPVANYVNAVRTGKPSNSTLHIRPGRPRLNHCAR